MSDTVDNLATALDAGIKLAAALPRVTWIEHPEVAHVKIPIALIENEGGTDFRVLADVVTALERRCNGPIRRSGVHVLTEVDSFIAFVQRWGALNESTIYADTVRTTFTAVLDDHPPGEHTDTTAWREHRAQYACPRSAEWKAWTERDGRPMRQTEFADFLESRLEDMTAGEGFPSPLDVLTVARQLNVRTKGEYRREVDPTTGDNILVVKSETETGSTVIPRSFLIAVPVFEGGDRYQVEGRMRFGMVEGVPQFMYVMHRRAEIERDAFGTVRAKIIAETKLPMFAGIPG